MFVLNNKYSKVLMDHTMLNFAQSQTIPQAANILLHGGCYYYRKSCILYIFTLCFELQPIYNVYSQILSFTSCSLSPLVQFKHLCIIKIPLYTFIFIIAKEKKTVIISCVHFYIMEQWESFKHLNIAFCSKIVGHKITNRKNVC